MDEHTHEGTHHRRVIGSEIQSLKVMLTEVERQKRQDELLVCHRDLRSWERDEADMKAQLKRRKSAIDVRTKNVVELLENGYEFRDVEVARIADYDAGLVRLVRQDTGEEIDVERMSDKDRQTELDLRANAQAADDVEPGSEKDPYGAPMSPGPAGLLGCDEIIEGEFVETEPEADEPADGAPEDGDPIAATVRWYRSLLTMEAGEANVLADLESKEPADLRDLVKHLGGAPLAGAQKRTLIPTVLGMLKGQAGAAGRES